MNFLSTLFRSLLPTAPSQAELDEAYLAGSTDIYDLERRIRDLDDRGRDRHGLPLGFGLYSR